ncbi:hypothetical protein C380_03200 [Acidovorax sp. KKS102]|uniref:DUF6447 family protein n=1 Tax=Acidovorax sp. KKS102 TaxID=358220 RepID=UPI0000256661|nr:DUF6447 family protein [Acidovorax sp. KKS102]AFU44365.1 hypothetical protein C380_03200 [Acidovorax sp. KKS102]
MALPESLTFNGNEYSVAALSEAARVQITNIQAVDAEIARLQLQLGIAQTARSAYVGALSAAMPAASNVVSSDAPAVSAA